MKCSEALYLIDAVLDSLADHRDQQLLRFHLNGCPDCRRAMLESSAISSEMQKLQDPSPPENLMQGIRSRLENGSYDKSPLQAGNSSSRWKLAAVLPFAAAAVLLLGSRYGGSGRVSFPDDNSGVSTADSESSVQYAPAEVVAYSRPSSVTTF